MENLEAKKDLAAKGKETRDIQREINSLEAERATTIELEKAKLADLIAKQERSRACDK